MNERTKNRKSEVKQHGESLNKHLSNIKTIQAELSLENFLNNVIGLTHPEPEWESSIREFISKGVKNYAEEYASLRVQQALKKPQQTTTP